MGAYSNTVNTNKLWRNGVLFALSVVTVSRAVFGSESFVLITQNDEGMIQLNGDGLSHLRGVAADGSGLSIVAVIGPYRTGKSFFLNHLINRDAAPEFDFSEPFLTGPTVQPTTAGIYGYLQREMVSMHCESGSCDNVEKNVLYLDTTGLYSPKTSEQSDARLMSLVSLVSSLVVYSHTGAIDSHAVAKFAFLTRYARSMFESSLEDDFKPDLVWLAQDFYLQLRDELGDEISATKWLSNILGDVENGHQILSLFDDVHAETLPFPVTDTSLLSKLSAGVFSHEYKTAFNTLRREILRSIRPKVFGKIVTGDDLADLLETYVEQLNRDPSFAALHTVGALVAVLDQKAVDNALKAYNRRMSTLMLPVSRSEVFRSHQEAELLAIEKLKSNLYSPNSTDEAISELTGRVSSGYDALYDKNELAIRGAVNRMIDESEVAYADEVVADLEMPIEEDVINERANAAQAKYVDLFRKQCREKFGDATQDDVDTLQEKFQRRLKKGILKQNADISDRVCAETVRSHENAWFSKEAIERVYSLESEYKQKKDELYEALRKTCVGPSRHGMYRRFDAISHDRLVADYFTGYRHRWGKIISAVIVVALILFAVSLAFNSHAGMVLVVACFAILGGSFRQNVPILYHEFGIFEIASSLLNSFMEFASFAMIPVVYFLPFLDGGGLANIIPLALLGGFICMMTSWFNSEARSKRQQSSALVAVNDARQVRAVGPDRLASRSFIGY